MTLNLAKPFVLLDNYVFFGITKTFVIAMSLNESLFSTSIPIWNEKRGSLLFSEFFFRQSYCPGEFNHYIFPAHIKNHVEGMLRRVDQTPWGNYRFKSGNKMLKFGMKR